jgi:hypothetical protein
MLNVNKMKQTTPLDILTEITFNNPAIRQLHFLTFPGYDLLQDRIDLTNELAEPFSHALEFRKKYNLPFWDGFNLSLFNKAFSEYSFINAVAYHNSPASTFVAEAQDLAEVFHRLIQQYYLTINSKVLRQDGTSGHIMLLDFHIPVDLKNQQLCVEIIKHLGLSGYLLVSGKSYHFYGDRIVDEHELLQTLSRALLFSPIIDRAWVAHQLIERSCCLRVTPKYNHLPYLIERI